MRIAINARFLIRNQLEGIGWYSAEVLRRIVQLMPEHQFLFLFDRPYSEEFIYGENVEAKVVFPPARHAVLWYLWYEKRIPKILKEWKADLFFSPDGYCSLSTDVPQYLVMHDLAYLHYPEHITLAARKYLIHYVPKYIRKAEHIFAVSKATKLDILQHYPIEEGKVSVAYNGCKSYFKPLSEKEKEEIRKEYSEGREYFLFVGALHPRKNVANLIYAFTSYKQKRPSQKKLLIVGRKAWNTEDIDLAYQRSDSKKDIHFIPYVDSQVLAKITGSAYCAVCPSFLEGFGVPALEALYCDIPLIVSERFSLPEVAGPGSLKVNPNSIDSIAEAILQMDLDQNIIDRIKLGQTHRAQFNWDQTAKKIVDIFYTAQ